MCKIGLLSIILLLSSAVSADPFYSDKQTENKNAKNPFNSPACQPREKTSSIYVSADFYTLDFVGVIKVDNKIKALFINQQNKLVSFSKNDLIIPSYIQISNIDLKQVVLIDWKNTDICQNPKTIQMKL